MTLSEQSMMPSRSSLRTKVWRPVQFVPKAELAAVTVPQLALLMSAWATELSSSQRPTEDGAEQPTIASDPAWQRRTTDQGHNRRTTEETDASMADDIGYRSTTDTEVGDPAAGGHRHRRTRSR